MKRARSSSDGAVRVTVRAKPRARQSRIVRAEGLTVEVALAAPPVDGAANEALVETLAAALSVGKQSVRLVQGAGSKSKVVEVLGLTADQVRELLAAAVG